MDPLTGAMWRFNTAEPVLGDLSSVTASGQEGAVTARTQALSGNERPDPAKQADQDIVEKLKKLKELKDSGIITDSEYETKRKALIDKLGT